ncbi:MAG: hypothetical protein WBG46_07330 [Nonlabens sp.]
MTYTTQEKHSLLGQLIKMALIDKKLKQEELAFVTKVSERLEIDKEDLHHMIKSPDNIKLETPRNFTKRIIHFHKLMLMMHIDGHVDKKELQFLHEVALKYGFRKSVVDALLESMKSYPHGEIPPSELLQIHSSQNN